MRLAVTFLLFAVCSAFAVPPVAVVGYDSATGEILSQDGTVISTAGISTTTAPGGVEYVGRFLDTNTLVVRDPTNAEVRARAKREIRRQIYHLIAIRTVANDLGAAADVAALDRDIRLLRARLALVP